MDNRLKPYDEYKETNILWNKKAPIHWEIKRGKLIFVNKKEINSKYQCSNILSLTLKGVVNNNINNPIGLVPKDYATYQIFERDNLVFKLIDLENYKTSRVGLVHEKGIMSPAYIRLERYVEGNTKYFYYQYYDLYLRGVYNKLGDGVRSTLSAKDLINLNIVIPPKEEQDQIVKYLDSKLSKINKFIKAKKKQIELLKEQKQAIINQAITKGLDPNAKMKPSGIEWLGDIPEGWKCQKFSRVAQVKSNLVHPRDYKSYIQVSPENIEKNSGKLLECKTVLESGIISDNHLFYKGQILYSKVRPMLNKVTIAPFDGLCSADMYPIETRLDSKYLLYFMLSNIYLMQLSITENRVKMPKINKEELSSIIIVEPPKNIQLELVNYIEEKQVIIDYSIDALEKEIYLMAEYRTSLISSVVTGKVDVRSIEVEDVIENLEEEFDDLEELDMEEAIEKEDDL